MAQKAFKKLETIFEKVNGWLKMIGVGVQYALSLPFELEQNINEIWKAQISTEVERKKK